jgi:hypothetical protein
LEVRSIGINARAKATVEKGFKFQEVDKNKMYSKKMLHNKILPY